MTDTTTALIYARVTPVTQERYGRHSVDIGRDFRFAAHLQAVPALAEEFANIARICPIVFAGPAEAPLPNALLSLRQDVNPFIGPKGGWAAPYIPAFLRRYPFISAPAQGNEQRMLCIDDAFGGLNTEGRGHPLFDDDGTPSAFLAKVGKFVANFDGSLQSTRAFVARLKERDLLEPLLIRIKSTDEAPMQAIGGMFAVSRARLDALDEASRAPLREAGDLERCAVHLRSLDYIRQAGKSVRQPAPTARP